MVTPPHFLGNVRFVVDSVWFWQESALHMHEGWDIVWIEGACYDVAGG